MCKELFLQYSIYIIYFYGLNICYLWVRGAELYVWMCMDSPKGLYWVSAVDRNVYHPPRIFLLFNNFSFFSNLSYNRERRRTGRKSEIYIHYTYVYDIYCLHINTAYRDRETERKKNICFQVTMYMKAFFQI